MNRIYFSLLYCVFLIAQPSYAQNNNAGKPFRGSFGGTIGYTALNNLDFQQWLTNNGGILISPNNLNLGLQGFIVRRQAVFGVHYQYDGPATFASQNGKTSPKNDQFGIFFGIDPMKEDDDKHILITMGLGYCETSARFHSNPPYILQDPSIPDQLARLKQANFYLNPKVLLLYAKKLKLGMEAGAHFYFFGNYKYGYDYTYYTYGYNSNGTYTRQSHTQFIGYGVSGIPNFGQVSLNISAFIGI